MTHRKRSRAIKKSDVERNTGASALLARPLLNSVLQLIWKEREISRADIARQAQLSRSTVSEIVSILLPTELIAEVGTGPSRGGRRPIVLQFQDSACCILGVEMGGTHVAAALMDLRGRVLAWRTQNFDVRGNPEGTRKLMAELCDSCLALRPQGQTRLVGVGVAVASPVDPEHPDHLSELVLPDWHGRGGLRFLGERYDVPVMIDNDANLGALAEHWWGAGRDVEDFAYVKVGTGVGSGHVIGGEIYRGATGVAGEIGHLAIDPGGEPCICGLRGCLATFVGGQALIDQARRRLEHQPDSALAGIDLTVVAIEDAALAGDPLARQISREAAEHLGVAIAGLLNLMNPSMVIIGGSLARLGELLLEPLRETVAKRTLVSSVAASAIRTSQLGPGGIAIGAATMLLKAALQDARLFPEPAAAKEA